MPTTEELLRARFDEAELAQIGEYVDAQVEQRARALADAKLRGTIAGEVQIQIDKVKEEEARAKEAAAKKGVVPAVKAAVNNKYAVLGLVLMVMPDFLLQAQPLLQPLIPVEHWPRISQFIGLAIFVARFAVSQFQRAKEAQQGADAQKET